MIKNLYYFSIVLLVTACLLTLYLGIAPIFEPPENPDGEPLFEAVFINLIGGLVFLIGPPLVLVSILKKAYRLEKGGSHTSAYLKQRAGIMGSVIAFLLTALLLVGLLVADSFSDDPSSTAALAILFIPIYGGAAGLLGYAIGRVVAYLKYRGIPE